MATPSSNNVESLLPVVSCKAAGVFREQMLLGARCTTVELRTAPFFFPFLRSQVRAIFLSLFLAHRAETSVHCVELQFTRTADVGYNA
jgi:hypothetical protein